MGINVSTYNSHERAGQPGARSFSVDDAKRYGRRFRVSPAWLLVGEGAVEPREPVEKDRDRFLLSSDPDRHASLLVGQFLLHWGTLDHCLDEAAKKLLKSPLVDTADIVYFLGHGRSALLESAANAHMENNRELARTAKTAVEEIQNLTEIRNRIVQGRFVGTADWKVKLTWVDACRTRDPSEMIWSEADFLNAYEHMQQHTRAIEMFIEAVTKAPKLRDFEQAKPSTKVR
jgi:hypothetical protein